VNAKAREPRRAQRLLRDTRGSIFIEYTVVLALVGIASIPVLLEVGTALAGDFELARGYVLGPVP
jgi:Flp pilus assembly pilin Flp